MNSNANRHPIVSERVLKVVVGAVLVAVLAILARDIADGIMIFCVAIAG